MPQCVAINRGPGGGMATGAIHPGPAMVLDRPLVHAWNGTEQVRIVQPAGTFSLFFGTSPHMNWFPGLKS